jgi:hypothetical protein
VRRDLVLAGSLGFMFGWFLFLAVSWIKGFIPSLVSSLLPTVVVFAILFILALIEMPIMVFGLRRMAASATTPRAVMAGGFMLYVLFAAVYAAIFVLVTGDRYYDLGTLLAAFGFVRLASGMLIR